MKQYAHSLGNSDISLWQPLDKHLERVAKICKDFCSQFSSEEMGYLVGRVHDVPKSSLEWQAYIRGTMGVIDEISKKYYKDGKATVNRFHKEK